MTVGSMFTGIGGLDLGFERAGFEVRWMVERDPFCVAALHKHWPGVPVYRDAHMSIAQWEAVEPVDVIIGGFPCQDVSSAGLRRGLSGDRSGLWWCMRRAARVVGPRYLVVENVTGLLVRGIDTVLGSVAKLGFDAEWATVRASDVQAPHRRARVFVVAYPAGDRRDRGRLTQLARESRAQWRELDRCSGPRGLYDAQVADTDREPGRCRGAHGEPGDGSAALRLGPAEPRRCGAAVADAPEPGPQGRGPEQPGGWSGPTARAADRSGLAPTRWPAGPGELQHAWEPPRTVPSRRAQSALGAQPDGVPVDVAGWRRAALQATGNSVVPQVAEVVARRILELDRGEV